MMNIQEIQPSQAKLATKLAQAMIQKIKDENLMEDLIEVSDDLEGLLKSVFGVFSMALMPIMLEYAEHSGELDETEQQELKQYQEMLKLIKGE